MLLAHYAPGTYNGAFNQAYAQELDAEGGAPQASPTFGPDPCQRSGHQRYTGWNPAGRELVMQCGPAPTDIWTTARSSGLFTDFVDGDKGLYGAAGTDGAPGWGIVAAVGSGLGRTNHSTCGGGFAPSVGGIGYCNGPAAGYANHVVSIYSPNEPWYSPDVGCGGTGCHGSTCFLHIWVWLKTDP